MDEIKIRKDFFEFFIASLGVYFTAYTMAKDYVDVTANGKSFNDILHLSVWFFIALASLLFVMVFLIGILPSLIMKLSRRIGKHLPASGFDEPKDIKNDMENTISKMAAIYFAAFVATFGWCLNFLINEFILKNKHEPIVSIIVSILLFSLVLLSFYLFWREIRTHE